jgi:hypothetical protein
MRSRSNGAVLDCNFNQVKMARKAFTPTQEGRHLVKVLSSFGIRQADIGTEVGLRSPKTLRKHFRLELDRGRIRAYIMVGKTLYAMATSGKHASAAIYWLNRLAMRTFSFLTIRGDYRPPLLPSSDRLGSCGSWGRSLTSGLRRRIVSNNLQDLSDIDLIGCPVKRLAVRAVGMKQG